MTLRLIPIFGVIGHPIDHVRSPGLFNRYLADRHLPGTMIPIDIAPQNLPDALAGLRRIENLAGFLVTMPHKETVLGLLDQLSAGARAAGAVNIVRRSGHGRLYGAQLDGVGFVAAARDRGEDPSGKSIFVAGAGGASAGICSALAAAGAAKIAIFNRSRGRAQSLVERLTRFYPRCELVVTMERPGPEFDIVINATSLGLRSTDPLPIDLGEIRPNILVADIVITPKLTPLLEAAQRRHCRIQFGEDMVASQLSLMVEFFGELIANESGA